MLSPYDPIGCKLLCVHYRFKNILSNVTSSSDVICSFSEAVTLFSLKMRFSVRYYWSQITSWLIQLILLSNIGSESFSWFKESKATALAPLEFSHNLATKRLRRSYFRRPQRNVSLLTATILLTCWGGPRSWLNRWLCRWLGHWTSWPSRWLGHWTSWLSRWLCGWPSRGDFWKHTRTWALLRVQFF